MVCTSILHLVDGVGRLDVWSDFPTYQRLSKDLRLISRARHKVYRAFLLDIVI